MCGIASTGNFGLVQHKKAESFKKQLYSPQAEQRVKIKMDDVFKLPPAVLKNQQIIEIHVFPLMLSFWVSDQEVGRRDLSRSSRYKTPVSLNHDASPCFHSIKYLQPNRFISGPIILSDKICFCLQIPKLLFYKLNNGEINVSIWC